MPATESTAADLKPFLPVGEYKLPPLPADESARLYFKRLTKAFRKKTEKPFIESAELEEALAEILDDVVSPPACGTLIDELELTVGKWAKDPTDSMRMKLIVLPPCDRNGVVEAWALRHGHKLVPPPARNSLLGSDEPELPDFSSEGELLVIPRLEEYFLRHFRGMETVRRLLSEVTSGKRRCLIGCDSFAWKYLSVTLGADLALPTGLVFQPFDELRLHHWFSQLKDDASTRGMEFRLSKNGQDIMETDANGKPKSDFLKRLASRSLGIPWIAWHLWRRSLRSAREHGEDGVEKNDEDEGGNERPDPLDTVSSTLWVVDAGDFSLPKEQRQASLMVLHAVLIHGALTVEELRQVLPLVGESFVIAALARDGFVELEGDHIRCRPAAYPSIRSELSSSGFSIDSL